MHRTHYRTLCCIPCFAMLHSTLYRIPCCTVLYRTVPSYTVLYRAVPYCTKLYRAVPYCTVLYQAVPCCTVPYTGAAQPGDELVGLSEALEQYQQRLLQHEHGARVHRTTLLSAAAGGWGGVG